MNFNNCDAPVYLMNIPFSYSTEVRNNVWMEEYSAKDIIVNKPKAIREMWEVYTFLSGVGFVYLLPTPVDCNLQDLVFTANNGILLSHLDEPVFVGSNFTVQNRVGEEQLGMNFFQQFGISSLQCPFKFEGEAELKYLRDNIYIGGYGIRSSKEAYEWMEQNYEMNIIKLQMNDPYMYHLDCCIFPLTKEKIIVAVDAFSKKEIRMLESVAELIPITLEQAHTGLTNSVRANNYILNASDIDFLKPRTEDYRLETDKNKRLEEIASENAMEVCYFNMEEYMKGGGLLSCLVLHMNHRSKEIPLL